MSLSGCPRATYNDDNKILCRERELCGHQRYCRFEGRYILSSGAIDCTIREKREQKRKRHFSFRKLFKNN